ncbi:MAG: RnfABCDGE type electron transport complex subunit D [Bacteroidales bacterium]|nr:RnfABCDGE type electron transport complex subunit D [Bacteroidales bacterium]
MQKLLVSPSPHIHTDVTTRRLMLDVVIALLPATLVSIVFYGWSELLVLAVSILSCVGLEWVITKYLLKRDCTIGDMSAVVTGLLLALNLPSITPWWVVFIGAVVAIGVAKLSFGGLGQNLFNPAIVARVFLLISFPAIMTTWPEINAAEAWRGFDAETGATLLGEGVDVTKITIGDALFSAGSAGEISVLALLLGFVYLLVRRVIKPWITLSIWGTVLVFAGILYLVDPSVYMSPVVALLSGGIMLGSIFMATDYVTSPMTTRGGIIFGVGIGLLTIIIRCWGSYPEGVSFAILLMNACVPLINKFCPSKKFGRA